MPGRRPPLPLEIQKLLNAAKKLGKGRPKLERPFTKQRRYLYLLAVKDWQERQRLAKLWVGAGILRAHELDPERRKRAEAQIAGGALMRSLRRNARSMIARGWKPGLPLSHRGATEP